MPLSVPVNGNSRGIFMSKNPIQIPNAAGYDRWANTYDEAPNSTIAADEAAFPRWLAQLANRTVLEIGCGTGRHTVRLVAQGNTVTGIDLSSGMLARARQKLAGAQVTFLQGDFITVEFAETFDAIVGSLVLEHFGDLDAFFARVSRLLKKDGQVFLSEIHPDRTARGSQARFESGGAEHLLTSFAHRGDAVERAAAGAGLSLVAHRDILATEEWIASHPEHRRYRGQPMLVIWQWCKPN